MSRLNGEQLYGLRRFLATLRMGRHKELKGLSLKQKLALNYVSRESKLTRLDGKIFSNTFTPYFPSVAYDRFLKGVIQVAQGNPLPVVSNFAVTSRCPCRCWHCSFADRSRQDALSLNQLKQSIAEVQALGASVIGITGGEPLLRKDLEEIIACVDARSMPILFTTGYQLTSERVRRLKAAGLEIPVISLDHYQPERHDQGRGRNGMHATAIKAIRLFQDEGMYVAVSFVPDRRLVADREELFRTIDFFKDLGINDMRLTSPILSGHLTDRPEELLSPEHVETIFEVQKKCTQTPGYPGVFAYDFFESEQYYGCGAGYNYMFIDAQGNVCPCDFTMMSFGNVLKRPLTDIWNETSRHFSVPGPVCYANQSAEHLAAQKPEHWPVDRQATRAVLNACPSYDLKRIPEFYRRMGMTVGK